MPELPGPGAPGTGNPAAAGGTQAGQQAYINIADALRNLVPPNLENPAPPAQGDVPSDQSYPPVIKHPRIEVWLLKADGTLIAPVAYTCVPPSGSQTRSDEFTYRYSIADGTQAVAAAIRIDDKFYIEKLRPLESAPAAQ